MAEGTRNAFPRHPWDVVVAFVAAIALVVVIGLAALALVPPAIANVGSEASDGVTPVGIGDAGASVVVPSGWVVAGGGSPVVTVRSPDGALTVRLTAARGGLDSALEQAMDDAASATGTDGGAPLTEQLRSGSTFVHADVGDRSLAGALAASQDARASVRLVAGVVDGTTLAVYRPALAELVEGIRP